MPFAHASSPSVARRYSTVPSTSRRIAARSTPTRRCSSFTTRPSTSTVCTSPRWAWNATCPYGLSTGNDTGDASFFSSTTSAFLPGSRLPRSAERPSAAAPPRVAQSTTCSARSEQWVMVSPFCVGLEVLAGAVGAQRGAHGGEQVAAPPHAGVHRQRHRDVVRAQRPGGRVALARALLALGGDGHGAAGGRDAVVGVGRQGGGVHEDARLVEEARLVREPDAVVVRRAPHPRVRGDGHAELARHLVRRLLGERRVAGDVEGHLEAQPVVVEHAAGEGLEVRRRRPLPRAPAGCCRRRARSGRGSVRSASTAASACSTVCRPCDQSTHVVTPASSASAAASRLPARTSCGRKCLPDSR